MPDAVWPMLAPWTNFYIMMGSSAAALTGLMFVVITLVAGVERQTRRDGLSTFSTPTVVHFCAALFASATLVAPWPSATGPAVLLGLGGLCGVVYSLVLIVHARTFDEDDYKPDLEDWTWYMILPLIAYAAFVAGSIALYPAPSTAMFVLAGSVILFVFIGIHNAWDVVTYLAVIRPKDPPST